MKRLLIAVLLFVSASMAQAADMTLRIVGDEREQFKTMWNADRLKNGMNLFATDPTGLKLFADLKGQGGFATFDWVFTDAAGRALPSSLVKIENVTTGTPRSEELCLQCTEPPHGPRVCHEVPCPIRVPCCPNHHACCIK